MFKKKKNLNNHNKGKEKNCNAHGSDCTHDLDLVCRNIFKKGIRLGQREVGENWQDMRHYGVRMRMSRRRTGVDNVCELAWLEKGDGYRWKTMRLCAQRIRVGAQARWWYDDGWRGKSNREGDGWLEGGHNLWRKERRSRQNPSKNCTTPNGLQERPGEGNQREWTNRDMVQLKTHQKGKEPQSLVRMIETSRKKVKRWKGGR